MGDDKTYTVAEAAAQLGVSVDTVRRRVQAGSLEKVQMERGYAVILDQPPSPADNLLEQVLAERDRLIELVAFLQRQLDEASRREAALLQLIDARGAPARAARGDR
jgi:excisionase family DNA binding protein